MVVKKFFDWLLSKPKIVKVSPLDEENIRKDKQIREMAKALKARDAQLAKEQAKKKLIEEKKKDIRKEEELAQELNEQKQEILKEKFEGGSSLMKFYAHYLKSKRFRKRLVIVDREDSKELARFGDFVTLPGGYFGITDHGGNVLVYGKQLKDIIYKPDSLANQFKIGRIRLPCTKDWVFIPDIEEVEMPEMTMEFAKNGGIKWARVQKSKLKQIIIDRELIMRDYEEQIEHYENSIIGLKRELVDAKRSLRVAINSSEVAQSELSKMTEKVMTFEQRIGDFQMQIINLTQLKTINERMVETLERVHADLLERVEELGVKPESQKILNTLQSTIEWAKRNTAETIIEQPMKEEAPKSIVQPGQRI